MKRLRLPHPQNVILALSCLPLLAGCGRAGFDPEGACSPPVSGLLALYTFEDGAATDELGNHSGQIVGAVTQVPGPPGCGEAVRFPESGLGHVRIPDSPQFDLDQGAIDFWMRYDGPATHPVMGVVSRDAEFAALPGHLSVFVSQSNALVVRLQAGGGGNRVLCATQPKPVDPC